MTIIRGTPNLNIAATQNTAPVYEFRCLYSHDLRKKKKLWHDGSLRYHTFNKRVMVYDESKNYIGDSHWREADELQEGTELKLDKGVLVDVGDRIGQTQTDLAPLLEKRRPENASSPQRAPLRLIPLAATSRNALGNPQVRPKSLSDVLGISHGPIGRARFPAQSPFENLHHTSGQSSHCEEPTAKKPRIGPHKDDGGLCGERTQRRERLMKADVDSSLRRPGTSGTSSLQEKRRDAPAREVIDIFSKDEPAHLSSCSPKAASVVKAIARKTSNSGDDHQQLPKTPIPPPGELTKTTPIVRGNATPPKLAIIKPLSVARITSFGTSSTKSLSSTGSSKSKLRLAVQKPRKKLLYKELLPSSGGLDLRQQIQTRPSGNRQLPPQGQGSPRTPDFRPPKVSAFSDLRSEGGVGVVSVGKWGSSMQAYGQKQDIGRDLAELFSQPSSPLFMPQSPGRVAIAASESLSPPHSSPLKPLGAASGLSHSPKRTVAPLRGSGLVASRSTTSVRNDVLQPTPPSKLTIPDQELMMPPPKSAAIPSESRETSPQHRRLRRVVSENDSPGYASTQASAASVPPKSHTVEAASTSKLLGRRAFRVPAKLTKSLSDNVAESREQQPPAARPAEGKDTDDGPWSKAEAYLLFDWFPPGREKLVLDAGEGPSTSRPVVKRGLLFDQVDTL